MAFMALDKLSNDNKELEERLAEIRAKYAKEIKVLDAEAVAWKKQHRKIMKKYDEAEKEMYKMITQDKVDREKARTEKEKIKNEEFMKGYEFK